MARLGSRMIAGFVPCPLKMVRAIGALLRHNPVKGSRVNLVDPCAGEGEAAVELAAAIERVPVRKSDTNVFACEMEAGRAAALARRLRRDRRPELGVAVHGDAFRLQWQADKGGRALRAGVLYLNPPYDTDPEFGRTEERWLQHFVRVLDVDGGVLVFVIPITALAASADTLAKHFTGLVVHRFPDPYYETFKQIVVLGKRRTETFRPDPAVADMVRAFAAAPDTIPLLPLEDTAPLFMVPTVSDYDGYTQHVRFALRPLDAAAVAKAIRPWRHGEGGSRLVPGVLPENGVQGYMSESFTVALPLRPGYVAPALAVGVFDGVRLLPDDKASGLPPVFAKATFLRDWADVAGGERVNQEGEIISKLQVQQPRLIMTALDLRRGKYTKIVSSLARKSSTDLESMTALDFIEAYNGGLLATLRAKCTPLFDPSNENDKPTEWQIARPLWRAQSIAATAALRCIDQHGAALIEGETGTGKTSCGVAIASTMRVRRSRRRTRVGARRTVVVCPPHLLAEWLDEIAVLRPDARAVVLHDTSEADAFARDEGPTPLFGILAETTSKLAHGWAGLGDTDAQALHVVPPANDTEPQASLFRDRTREKYVAHVGHATEAHRAVFLAKKRHARTCPSCGVGVTVKVKDLASKRMRCEVKPRVPTNPQAVLVQHLARALVPLYPNDEAVTERTGGRPFAAMLPTWEKGVDLPEETEKRWARARAGSMRHVVREAVGLAVRSGDTAVRGALMRLLAAVDDQALTVWAARVLFRSSLVDLAKYGLGGNLRDTAVELLPLVRDHATGDELVAELRGMDPHANDAYGRWERAGVRMSAARGERTWAGPQGDLFYANGPVLFGERPGSVALARAAFELLRSGAETEEGPACGEALFAAVPSPRRVPIAEYLAKRWKHRIDLVIVDECHEATNQDSAQTQAMEQFRGRPMLGLTGTISNGYASSLFAILHTFSPLFRMEFKRDEIALFRERYGYMKRVLSDVDRETKKPVAFGTQSARVIRQTKTVGDAPGALPSFILRHFLPLAVPIHLSDLECEIPPLDVDRVELIDPGPVLGPRVRAFVATLAERIKQDAFTPMAGKLFGQMSEAWSPADRATLGIGNSKDGVYRACYPESVGGAEVCRLQMMAPDVVLPKEQRLIEIVRSELAEGRNVLICAWHAECGLYDRLAKLLKAHVGIETPILYSDKVPARGRKAWMKSNVIDRGARTMIVTSASIETGFNALVHFNTLVWFQPPGSAPRVVRQTQGRIRRPGQKKPQRYIWLVYKDTLQVEVHQLLQLKAAESMAVDGTDNSSALRAAGVEPIGGVGAFDLGRALYDAARKGLAA